ncbi:LPS export ABC transporter permease LptF [Tolumonas osonensis]|uniref:Lipopolysaccharide export system permease protein LptF n=1 Tax=Tolumonas osonensis TaxID=675874 RepID=A0A841G9P3_9GAMM|nr:lipopolysaccharide export system permease protein [Tolumonas osonensis]
MIVFRYIFKETLKTQLSILLILMLIFTSQQFIRILAKAADGSVPTSLIGQMMLLNIPYMGLLLLPISLFIAILFAHGRLYADSEITVLRATGVGPSYIMKISMVLALLTTVVAAANTLWLAPTAREMQSQLLDAAKADPLSIPLESGRFLSLDGGQLTAYVEDVQESGRKLQRIFLLQRSPDPAEAAIIVAAEGHLTTDAQGTPWVTLSDGKRYAGTPPSTKFSIANFSEYRAQLQRKDIEPSNRKAAAIPSARLYHGTTNKEIAEWQWRIALPLSIPVLTLIAVPLASVNPRQGRYAKLLPAVMLYLSYFLLLSAGQSAIERGQLPATPGLYIIPAIFALLFAIPMNLKNTRLWQHLRLYWHKEKC